MNAQVGTSRCRRKRASALRAGVRKLAQPICATAPPPDSGHWEPDPAGYTAMFTVLDRALHANLARFTLGLSPRAMLSAYLDWLGGVAFSPGKQAQLLHKAQRKAMRFAAYVRDKLSAPNAVEADCIEPLPQDCRFRDKAWRQPPFCFYAQGFLLTQQWWHNATTGVSGVTAQHEHAVEFAARQWLDVFSPSNFAWTNPVVIGATKRQGGRNLIRGWGYAIEDWQAQIAGRGPGRRDGFQIGVDVAATPGKVIYRNRLMELIQYSPTTEKVRAAPILIVPAWIMKYYILDLSPENSLVKHLVDEGHTVFMISWRNPGPDDRDLSLEDYRRLGPLAALDVIGEVAPGQKVNAVGYCLGGALLAIAAAAMARDGDERLNSLSLLATQTDFEEAGELMLFINEKQIAFLEDVMWEQGFLDAKQMAGAFQMLRSNDLVWSRMIKEYLLGEGAPLTDLMAWNADGTRLPYKMHTQYLEQLFLHNDLSEGRYKVDERVVSLGDIRAPLFVVATQTDHVAPWRSVFKLHQLVHSELTFALTNGGHNAGIVSDPRDDWRSYQIARASHELTGSPDAWERRTPVTRGSWWPAWFAWLGSRAGEWVAPPAMGGADGVLAAAPGEYVRQP